MPWSSLEAAIQSEHDVHLRYDVAAAYGRLMASASSRRPAAEHSGVAAGQEAELELDVLCQNHVLNPQAGQDIALLAAEDRGPTPTGALAFGCLLHLIRDEAASFWWGFAAGAGE